MNALFERMREMRGRGEAVGLCSVCSSHPFVMEATIRAAVRTGAPFLLEATANQVNQHGGYTGLVPEAFAARLRKLCAERGVDPGLVILGGDHLGPFPWRDQDARHALAEAEVLVRAFVRAGAGKIHLDASMACADDGGAIAPEAAARRAVSLCAAAEDEYKRNRATGSVAAGAEKPVYVIGTEVPVPGGEAGAKGAAPRPTAPVDLRATAVFHRRLFHEADLDDAWDRVIAVVVQPGVEFDALCVHPYARSAARQLTEALRGFPGLSFEGHSTDYQTGAALAALVEDGFSVLKVGPELTFAMREQLFGLARIEEETRGEADRSRLRETVLEAMTEDPRSWKGYYPEGAALSSCLTYAYSDRMRYYWDVPKVARSVAKLFANFGEEPIQRQLVSQHVPHAGLVAELSPSDCTAREIVLRGIERHLERYLAACESTRLAARV